MSLHWYWHLMLPMSVPMQGHLLMLLPSHSLDKFSIALPLSMDADFECNGKLSWYLLDTLHIVQINAMTHGSRIAKRPWPCGPVLNRLLLRSCTCRRVGFGSSSSSCEMHLLFSPSLHNAFQDVDRHRTFKCTETNKHQLWNWFLHWRWL